MRQLRNVPFATLLLLPFGFVLASWVELTTDELIEQSDLIISGTFIGETGLTLQQGTPDVIVGVIQIDDVYQGKSPGGVVLIKLRMADQPLVSSQLFFQNGQQGLWLLRLNTSGKNGLYVIDHPQRFVPDDSAKPLLKKIQSRN